MFKTYILIERAIEEGIEYGYKKAHKHWDDPDEETLKECILTAIMLQLDEIMNFEEDSKG